MGNNNNQVTWINRYTGASITGYETKVGINVTDQALGRYARQNESVGYGRGVRGGFFLGCIVSLAGAAIVSALAASSKKKKKEEKDDA